MPYKPPENRGPACPWLAAGHVVDCAGTRAAPTPAEIRARGEGHREGERSTAEAARIAGGRDRRDVDRRRTLRAVGVFPSDRPALAGREAEDPALVARAPRTGPEMLPARGAHALAARDALNEGLGIRRNGRGRVGSDLLVAFKLRVGGTGGRGGDGERQREPQESELRHFEELLLAGALGIERA